MPRLPNVARALLMIVCAVALPARGQIKIDLVNEVGATAPCIGIGVGMAIVKKCATWAEHEGFVRTGEVGTDGLTIGTEGKEDGLVTAVAPGSAGAEAGLQAGDRVVSVEGKPVRWTAAMEVSRQTFGEKGKEFKLTVRPAGGGAEKELTVVRGEAPGMQGLPKSDSMFVTMTLLVDWRGKLAPCSSAGPLGAATVAICASHFKPWGYVRLKEAGSMGFAVASSDVAAGGKTDAVVPAIVSPVVSGVDPGSGAAKAGLAVGDTIVAIDGKPLGGSVGALALERMFGREGKTQAVVVERGGVEIPAKIVLRKRG